MAKLSFIAGIAAGYVLGTRAGRQRYAQIKTVSGKVWHSGPVQRQVVAAKDAARTKAAPAVADLVADAARSTGQRLRASRTVTAQTREPTPAPTWQPPSSQHPWPHATRPTDPPS